MHWTENVDAGPLLSVKDVMTVPPCGHGGLYIKYSSAPPSHKLHSSTVNQLYLSQGCRGSEWRKWELYNTRTGNCAQEAQSRERERKKNTVHLFTETCSSRILSGCVIQPNTKVLWKDCFDYSGAAPSFRQQSDIISELISTCRRCLIFSVKAVNCHASVQDYVRRSEEKDDVTCALTSDFKKSFSSPY